MSSKYNKVTTIKVCGSSDSTKLDYKDYYQDHKWFVRIRIKDNSGEGYDDSEYYYLDKKTILRVKLVKYTNLQSNAEDNVYLKIYHGVPDGTNLLIITLDQTYSMGGYGEINSIKKLHRELSYWSL